MPDRSPLWPAQLDHIRLDSDDPASLIGFYRRALGMTPAELDDGTVLMQGPARRILIGRGVAGAQPFMAFKVQTDQQLGALRRHVVSRGLEPLASPSAIFASGAFAVRDPDGRFAVFGLPRADLPAPEQADDLPAAKLPGRLQHVVVASTALPALLRFYIKDPQGHRIEISAELENMPDDVVKRSWKHEERTLNLWGSAFMRS